MTDDFLGRLVKDPQLSRFFVGHNTESLQRIRQHVVDFLCNATGGPCLYTGQDMKTAHTGLKITDAEWNAAAQDLVQTLDKFKVPEPEKTEVLNAINGLKGDIVDDDRLRRGTSEGLSRFACLNQKASPRPLIQGRGVCPTNPKER